MRRHIVIPFVVVAVVGRPLGHKFVEMALQVLAHCRVGVLVDCQGGGGVLNEYVQYAAAHSAQVGDLFQNLLDRKSTRLNSSHVAISYAVFCLKKKKAIHNMRKSLSDDLRAYNYYSHYQVNLMSPKQTIEISETFATIDILDQAT